MEQVDWSLLHKILGDTTRRSIIELIKEKEAVSYTEIMSILRVTNTGRLNYHLKTLNGLISKDDQGKYHLTERGQLAINLLRAFPERKERKNQTVKNVAVTLLTVLGIVLILGAFSFASSSLLVTEVPGTFSNRAIPQNTSIYLTQLFPPNNSSQFNIHWSASNSISFYVLNSSQYTALQKQYNTDYLLINFTGMPPSYVDKYTSQIDSISLKLPQGLYYLYVGSTNTAVLDSLTLVQQQYQSVVTLSVEYLITTVLAAFGVLMIALAILIETDRIGK